MKIKFPYQEQMTLEKKPFSKYQPLTLLSFEA